MGDSVMRHIIALAATIICILAYFAGYYSGIHGWWWTVISVVIVYGGVYRLIDK